MPQNTHLEIITAEAERLVESRQESDAELLRTTAVQLANSLVWLPNTRSSHVFLELYRTLKQALIPLVMSLEAPLPEGPISEDFHWFYDNARLLSTELNGFQDALKTLKRIPHVRTSGDQVVPRALALAEAFLTAVQYQYSEDAFTEFFTAFQQKTMLELDELWALIPAIKLVLMDEIATRGSRLIAEPANESLGVGVCIHSLRDLGETAWKEVLEPLITFDHVLRQDPAGAYAEMDFESRNLYRDRLAKIAAHADFTEMEVANEALTLAQEAKRRGDSDPRQAQRESHVGYYLAGKGASALYERVGFKPPFVQRVQGWLRKHPDEFFLPAIEVLTFAVMSVVVLLLTDAFSSPALILLSMLVLLIPSSQSAVLLVNYLTTTVLRPAILAKLDFSEGVPDNCLTLVAIPSLLLNEKQVRGLVEDLEVRFLGNHDPNIHFALLTDLPDTREPAREDSPLIDLCGDLIRELNDKYASQKMGSFLLFHRHRVYNPRERSWMGWERKRGKLLDLNKLLRGQYDSFPVKVGDVSILSRVRFVITLDSDTELPRGSAHRMIGAMAHPMNQAIIDPEKNIVVSGYGILQPRVGVSVQSTSRSRLAAIYSGETGFDIYTRAVSDAYQDLYGEGIFTGKGIYEVDTVHRVLDRRFPRNSLLSHDLIEGAYARVGLASDIEVIEDYPSHYSAYNRRKHRWLRGDWQIAGWLFPRVLNELGARVENPISLISWWKIFDNLRRSLVEPATFLLLVFGWLVLGSARSWTLATLAILFMPVWFQFVLTLLRAAVVRKWRVAREAVTALYAGNVSLLLTLTFLAHQTLLSLDAVVRALVRRMVTRRRLLEWETAAEAELGVSRRAPVDVYLNWTPAVALGIAILILLVHPTAFPVALPILLLWASSKLISIWLNRPPVAQRSEVSKKDQLFLRRSALRTWRYFTEYSTAEHHWLIPDNVQEDPPAVAARLSPTNLGFLLNARQSACEFGYLTVPRFADLTLKTLDTVATLRKHRGHLLNWYDTHTLEPLSPLLVSSVDSGNLVASLWTLEQGCIERLRQPVLPPSLLEGLLDHVRMLFELRVCSRKRLTAIERMKRAENWLQSIIDLPESAFDVTDDVMTKSRNINEASWYSNQTRAQVEELRNTVRDYAPWFLPEFAALRNDPVVNLKLMDTLALDRLPDFIEKMERWLETAISSSVSAEQKTLYEKLKALLPQARVNTARLLSDLRRIASTAGKLANEMDFSFLRNERRKLMSIGFDAETQKLHLACYDLLGTESRTAIFVAIAKEDIPQESWFLLGRAHTLDNGRPVMLSWTGTLFEYLMPALWMRSHSNTLLERSRAAAVRSQQAYTASKGIPWGISESAYCKRDDAGNYQYYAFGVPHLAMHKHEVQGLVISPYSTFLALDVDPRAALQNMQRMAEMGWIGAYGFYESADYSSARRGFWRRRRYDLVRCWMAHHQGMSLLALTNFLHDNVIQRWFHSDRRVQATELLLHEKPVAYVPSNEVQRRTAAA